MRLAGNSKSDDVFRRPECRVVWKAFSICRNMAVAGALLLRFRVT
jgi:hypothetical protein